MSDNTMIAADGVNIPEFTGTEDALAWALRQFAPQASPKAPPPSIAVPAPSTAAREAFVHGAMQKYRHIRKTHPAQATAMLATFGVNDEMDLRHRPDVWAQFKTEIDAIAVTPPSVVVPALPTMMVNSKDKFEANLDYIERTLAADGLLSFDNFSGRVMIQRGANLEQLTDTDQINMRIAFEREKNFAAIGKELMRDAIQSVAERYRYDSGQRWLDAQVWDGVPRVDLFMHTHFGAEDSDYTRAVGRYMWTGLAGRMYEPGCQLDMLIALKSKQGTKKSTGLKALVPNLDWFTDGLSLHEDTPDFKRQIRGKVIVEIAELAGLSKGDINVVKRMITRTTEKHVEKWQTIETSYERRCMLFASTNDDKFLPQDETGHRRWLPVEIVELNRALIKQDRDQLWAEGAAIWRESGIAYAEAERLAAGRHGQYEARDVWEVRIGEWLTTTPPTGVAPYLRPVTISEVLEGAIRMQAAHMDAKASQRAARVLRQIGYESEQSRVNGVKGRWWVLKIPPPPPAG